MMQVDQALSRISILVAEDDAVMAKVVRDMLFILGFRDIEVVGNGKEAIFALMRRTRDIIICDWKMQPMDGLEFTKFMRQNAESPDRFVPIIMLTGKGEERDVMEARDAGITEFVVKPFTAQGLFDRIRTVIETPRNFVIAGAYKGPDRRRREAHPPTGTERRKRRDNFV